MNPDLLTRMRDIHELHMDSVSWWPPAIGWWLLAAGLLALLVLLWWGVRNLRDYPPGTWHRDARNQLIALKKLSRQLSPEQSLRELSELLRRIAVTRLGREQAAGLNAEAWLAWLQQQDPEQFSWREKARILITVPYAPPGHSDVSQDQVTLLIDAALNWAKYDRRNKSAHMIEVTES
ncbi:DUF4381 domain-containing protein [Thiolapillus sp.]